VFTFFLYLLYPKNLKSKGFFVKSKGEGSQTLSAPFVLIAKKKPSKIFCFSMVYKISSMRMVGLEPTRGCPRKILSLVRLPFRHIRSA
jgi:hypothetical protein